MTPRLACPLKRWSFDAPRNPAEERLFVAGATSLVHDRRGGLVGVYVDNETPNRDAVAAALRSTLPLLTLVIVGLYPSEPHYRIAGCVCALEWYPYPDYVDSRMPHAEAYIVQRAFSYYGPPPPRRQWMRVYLHALARRPKFVLTY